MSTEQESAKSGFYKLHEAGRQVVSNQSSAAQKGSFAQLLFQNERIQVYDFRLPANESITIPHDLPTIRWQVDEGCHNLVEETTTVDDKQISKCEECLVPDRKVFFISPGTTWKLTNKGTSTSGAKEQTGEYRQIVFVLQSDKPKYSEEKVQELFQQAQFSTNVGTDLMFENELCRVWDFYLAPGEGGGAETVHHHCLDYVFINVAPSRLLGLDPQTLDLNNLLFDSISQDNQVTWNTIPEAAAKDKAFAHGGKNGYDDRPMREYLVELK